MCTDRRNFLRASAGVIGTALFAPPVSFANTTDTESIPQRQDIPESIRRLKPMTTGVVPISDDERSARIAKAQRLMAEHGIDAIYIEPGSSLFRSEEHTSELQSRGHLVCR